MHCIFKEETTLDDTNFHKRRSSRYAVPNRPIRHRSLIGFITNNNLQRTTTINIQ